MTDIVERLRAYRITHHQVSEDYEPYETVERRHYPPAIQIEAADEIERLRAELAKYRRIAARVIVAEHRDVLTRLKDR